MLLFQQTIRDRMPNKPVFQLTPRIIAEFSKIKTFQYSRLLASIQIYSLGVIQCQYSFTIASADGNSSLRYSAPSNTEFIAPEPPLVKLPCLIPIWMKSS